MLPQVIDRYRTGSSHTIMRRNFGLVGSTRPVLVIHALRR